MVATALTLSIGFGPANAQMYANGPVNSGCVALTFDDGPDPQLTPALLEILAERHVVATFFLVGEHVALHPEIVRQIVAAGHEIGNHSWDHPHLDAMPYAAVVEQFARTDAAIFDAVGFVPAIARAPYGAVDSAVVRAAQRPVIQWTFATLDWRHDSVAFVEHRVSRMARAGAIILMHDVQPVAVAAIGAVIDDIEARGFGFATVSDMLAGAVCRPAIASQATARYP